MGKSTISMAIFNSYVKLPEGTVSDTLVEPKPECYEGHLDTELENLCHGSFIY